MSQQTSTKAPRLTPCPPRLKRILDAENLLPPGVELPDVSYLSESSIDEIHAQLAEILKSLPRAFSKHVWSGSYGMYSKYASVFVGTAPAKARERLIKRMPGSPADEPKNEAEARGRKAMESFASSTYDSIVRGALTEYGFVRQYGKSLRELAREAAVCRADGKRRSSTYNTLLLIEIDANGIATTHRNFFGEAVDGEDLSRIRECAICGRVFWAGREDKSCCSDTCQRTKRNKNYQPNRPPSDSVVKRVIDAKAKLIHSYKLKEFTRTPEMTRDLAEWAGVTVKQCEKVLDLLEKENQK